MDGFAARMKSCPFKEVLAVVDRSNREAEMTGRRGPPGRGPKWGNWFPGFHPGLFSNRPSGTKSVQRADDRGCGSKIFWARRFEKDKRRCFGSAQHDKQVLAFLVNERQPEDIPQGLKRLRKNALPSAS
jgi:hypothetical protein